LRLERFGKHEVVRKIASGGMSNVYLCRLRGEEGFEKKTAVKVIHPRLSAAARFRELFIREARIAASLSHPNLVQVFDFGREGDSYFLAMEYVDGWNLAQAMAQMRLLAVRIPLPVWRSWTEGIVEGLACLHSRRIVHRDVSPSNVLVSRDGRVKIADFGIARRSADREAPPGTWEGKLSYLSPERARGEGASFASDLFAAAVIAAELFLPGRLFDGKDAEETLRRIREHSADRLPVDRFPPEASPILGRALSPAREDRYPDAASMAAAISRAVRAFPSRAEHAAFWDLLFPDPAQEEDTVIDEGGSPGGGADRVRESRVWYGAPAGRRLRLGIVSGLAAASLGAVLLWNASRDVQAERAGLSPAASGVPFQPRSPSSSAEAGATVGGPGNGPGSTREAAQERSAGATDEGSAGAAAGARIVLLRTGPAGATVALEDGTVLGKTPLHIDLSAWGGRTLLLRKEGYEEFRIRGSGLSRLPGFRVELERSTGTLEVVQAIPWARVYHGDRFLGITPLASVPLPAGRNRLRFVNEALGVDRTESVDVRPGPNPKLIVPLLKPEGRDGP
jgi:tRNA A-37 threonylcarbamoyl transferase component Bud32